MVSAVALSCCGLYEFLMPWHYISQSKQSIEERVEIILSSTEMLSSSWTKQRSVDQDTLLRKIWQIPTAGEWIENGVSFYLFKGDSMVFWSNHTYGDPQFNEIVLAPSSTATSVDSTQVLIFSCGDSLRRAVTLIKLADNINRANSNIFRKNNVKVHSLDGSSQLDVARLDPSYREFEVMGKIFACTLPVKERYSWFFSTLGWMGLFAGIVACVMYMASRTRRGNVFRNASLLLLGFVLVRILIKYFDFPQGASHVLTYLPSALVWQTFILLFVGYLYSVRQKIRWRVDKLGRTGRWVVLAIFALFMSIFVFCFHYIMMEVIFNSLISVEVYNIFSMSLEGFLFYLICSIFTAYRIMFSVLGRVVFNDYFKPIVRVVFSMVLMMGIVIPLNSYIHGTAFYILVFHFVFTLLSSRCSKLSINRIFLRDIFIITVYMVVIMVVETSVSKQKDAMLYAKNISQSDKEISTPYYDFTYSVISPEGVFFKPGHQIELGLVFAHLETRTPHIVKNGGYVHAIYPDREKMVVVSYPRPTVLDVVALFCYIFLGLYVVTGFILMVVGANIYTKASFHTLSSKVRILVVGIVISSMIIVAFVVYDYSARSYQSKQRESINGSLERLLKSFDGYCHDNSKSNHQVLDPDSLAVEWYNSRVSSFSTLITLYNISGSKIEGSVNSPGSQPSMLDHDAWLSLSVNQIPYFDKYAHSQSTVYASLFDHGRKIGYISVTTNDQDSGYARYTLLGNIFNVFVLMIVLSIILSLILYSLISGPIRSLTYSMGRLGDLQAIPVKMGSKMDDEVGRLILQYNNLVRYLEDSTLALARSEREGAWRDMARQVAHEIKNPLTPMKLKIQMLQRARQEGLPQIEERLDSTLDLLSEQIDVLANIASEFSDLARIEQGALVLIELDSMLVDVVGLYNNSNTIEVRFEPLTPNPLFVMASYTTLWRLFVNLLQNATQAIDSVGVVTVSLNRDENFAVIMVRDSGRGIDEALIDRIFEPNFTTKSTGSGLGLAICRQIALNFRGTISVSSTPCVGSVFTVRLPLV